MSVSVSALSTQSQYPFTPLRAEITPLNTLSLPLVQKFRSAKVSTHYRYYTMYRHTTNVISLRPRLRFDFEIDVDSIMLSTLNALFAVNQRSKSTFSNVLPFTSPSFPGFQKETARLIFEDLRLCGRHATEMEPILNACGYSDSKKRCFLIL